MNADAVLRRRSEVRFRVIDGEAVVIVQDTAEVLAVNEVGARVIELVDGHASISALVDRLEAEFEVERERLMADVLRYVDELVAAAVLEPVE